MLTAISLPGVSQSQGSPQEAAEMRMGLTALLELATVGYHASFGAEAGHETMLRCGDASDEVLRTRQPGKAKQWGSCLP
jgi:hypothetical protein